MECLQKSSHDNVSFSTATLAKTRLKNRAGPGIWGVPSGFSLGGLLKVTCSKPTYVY